MKGKDLIRRLCQMLITLLGVTFLTFGLTYLAPGDPVEMILETGDTMVSQETIEKTRHELGLDRPFHEQYLHWLSGLLHGDMGMSYSAKMPVAEKLEQNLLGTLLLAGTATLMMLVVSMPSFWVGLLLLFVFGLKLGLFPISGGEVTLEGLILPSATLAILLSSKYTRQVRIAVLEEFSQDYVIGAKARGLSMQRILWRHVLPNAFLPLITLFGLALGWLLGGVAIVEIVFGWPGIGRLAVRAIEMRDYPLLEGFVLWTAIFYMVVNFLVDLSYVYLDPRLKKGAKS